ncbi:MAG TPA: PIN domain-containing protein [Burkholderiaceae bacterium]|nr:PIN domain-containing protein [Burkholderiaceae bacterium]
MLPSEIVTRLEASATQARTAIEPLRVVLDTNAVLDWRVFGDPDALAVGAAIEQRRLQWLTTPRMLAELSAVLQRPLPAHWEPARKLALTIDLAASAVVCSEPARAVTLACRDAGDQVFIDLAHAMSPVVLLTRDRALLALRRRASHHGIEISTAAAWRPQWDGLPRRTSKSGDRPWRS